MNQGKARAIVMRELNDAQSKFPKFNSAHEGYAVILEELDELWKEVKKNNKIRSKSRLKDEAKQVSAMAMRFLIDCC